MGVMQIIGNMAEYKTHESSWPRWHEQIIENF